VSTVCHLQWGRENKQAVQKLVAEGSPELLPDCATDGGGGHPTALLDPFNGVLFTWELDSTVYRSNVSEPPRRRTLSIRFRRRAREASVQ
jgi:hypothetical protein